MVKTLHDSNSPEWHFLCQPPSLCLTLIVQFNICWEAFTALTVSSYVIVNAINILCSSLNASCMCEDMIWHDMLCWKQRMRNLVNPEDSGVQSRVWHWGEVNLLFLNLHKVLLPLIIMVSGSVRGVCHLWLSISCPPFLGGASYTSPGPCVHGISSRAVCHALPVHCVPSTG